jgi:hypothetical protein
MQVVCKRHLQYRQLHHLQKLSLSLHHTNNWYHLCIRMYWLRPWLWQQGGQPKLFVWALSPRLLLRSECMQC